MNEMNFDWDDLRLFLAVARGGGLAAAVAATGKSAPTLGRRMLALERRLGADLFYRLPRGYDLTAEGKALLAKAIALESAMRPIMVAAPARATPTIKISAGLWVTHLLCTRADEIIGRSGARLRFIADDDLSDIGRRQALIGIRNKRPTEQGLAGRKVANVTFAVYATHPKIRTWARVVGVTPSAKWVEEEARGCPSIELTSSRNALDLALAGIARAVLPTFIGRRFDGLQQVSSAIAALTHDQWLVTHHEDRYLPEVRPVVDRIGAILQDLPRH